MSMSALPRDKKFQHLTEWIDGDNAAAFVKPATCNLNGILRGKRLPATWHEAISRFKASNAVREMFSNLLVDVFSACKRQELDTFAETVPSAEHKAYLEAV